jgi:hypothetical protein
MGPARTIHLYARDFGDAFACTGNQVAAVIACIGTAVPGLKWFGADVQGVGEQLLPECRPEPALLGDVDEVVEKLRRVEQFESGVFVGVCGMPHRPNFREGGLWTDDDDDADLGDALVEVRAFDTTYVVVSSSDRALSELVRDYFRAS